MIYQGNIKKNEKLSSETSFPFEYLKDCISRIKGSIRVINFYPSKPLSSLLLSTFILLHFCSTLLLFYYVVIKMRKLCSQHRTQLLGLQAVLLCS